MMGRKITLGLTVEDIDRAIKELEDYKAWVEEKTNLFRKRVADRLADEAQHGFSGAIVDDVILEGGISAPEYAQVDVTVDNQENVTVVIANGEDAVWVEFGAGVFYNGSPGSSPHPNGAELGFTIGGFGEGNGKRQTWGYYEGGKGGELKLTHGTPASMPMSRAVTTVCTEIVEIAREVFS